MRALSPSRTERSRLAAWALVAVTGVACAPAASRTPLGGDYRVIEAAAPAHRASHLEAKPTASAEASTLAPAKLAPAAASAASADAGVASADADSIRYQPLKDGDHIRAEVAIAFSSKIQGNSADLSAGGNELSLDAKLRVELKIVKSSAQSLDELEVTLTPVSMHTDFDGQRSDSAQDPPETYDITLSGRTPSIRSRSGTPLEKEDRVTLTVLLTPLIEFHSRWASSPTLNLKPGWSAKVPLAPPSVMSAPGESMHVGPLIVRYSGRDSGATSVPFELGLPIAWSTDFGSLSFDCSGRAVLGEKGRPISLDLSGPITGNVGPSGSQVGLTGTAKFSATLSYP